jgi:uncharacterized protein (TIGR02217 family)
MEIVINDFVKDAAYGCFDEQAPLEKRFRWFTDMVKYDSRAEQRNQTSEAPERRWAINWEWLDEPARSKLIELFQRAKGKYDFFLYRDGADGGIDNDGGDQLVTVTDWSCTLTTGDTTTQLQQTYYKGETEEWTEDRTKIQPSSKYVPTIYVDDVAKTEGADFTLDDTTGLITWTGHTPATAEVVTADYKFYFKVRFEDDAHRDIQHQIGYWAANKLSIIEDIS